jgi:hypothetical protein
MVVRDGGGIIQSLSLGYEDSDTGPERGDVEDDAAVCLRSGLQAAALLSLGDDAVKVAKDIPGLGVIGTNGGGVERSRAGDSKDKLAKDVRGEIDGGIRVVDEDSICWFVLVDDFVDEIVVGSKKAGIGGGGMLAG